MSKRTTARGTATTTLLYWLLVVCGLALVAWQRVDAPDKVLPLWVGAVMGTALGQALAWRRLRLWLLAFVVGNAMWFGALLIAPFWWFLWAKGDAWDAVSATCMAFGPAAICGYFSLSERGGLTAFWFPAMLWMLGILDRPEGATLAGRQSWLLLSGLGALFVAFFRARETRRLALWRTHGTSPVVTAREPKVLHQAPLRTAGQLAWTAVLGALTLALTGWIAPQLWQKEDLGKTTAAAQSEALSTLSTPASLDGTQTCCPEESAVEKKHERVREYLPLLHGQGAAEAPLPPATYCVTCKDGVLPVAQGSGTTPGGTAPPAPHHTGPLAGSLPGSTGGTVGGAGTGGTVVPTPAPLAYDPQGAAEPPVVAGSVAAGPARGARRTATGTLGPRSAALRPRAVVVVQDSPAEVPVLAWLITLALTALAVQLVTRPLRRWLTLHHLRRPLWAETVDQRVSNLWQLALVGLRDAGFRAVPGEQPQELARRIGLEGLSACALVLERARHGVRVDQADLEAMERAARAAYAAARARAGVAARAASWLRWPLA